MNRFLMMALLLASALTHAESMYVNDKLVVNVYADADQASQKVETIETGDAVEVLDRTEGGFAHVKLVSGREGYVRLSYLTAQVPAIVRLKELQGSSVVSTPSDQSQEIAKLKERNTTLETDLAATRNKIAAAPATTASCPQPKPVIAPPMPAEKCISAAPVAPVYTGISPLLSSGLALIGVVVGFALGYRYLAARIRKKYRGLKIY